ncbi:hypothetical protein MicloDRAFT_00034750 [Microvirga lotononidis]|uniref:Uncharacterized protein n=1 Tax=Microvirga lotononidis TaxID=864069 RepID=I4YSI0_9HYPH|nr:hypothetical protein MicloDRAFT_00034750 [Microvirga lotononidis]
MLDTLAASDIDSRPHTCLICWPIGRTQELCISVSSDRMLYLSNAAIQYELCLIRLVQQCRLRTLARSGEPQWGQKP